MWCRSKQIQKSADRGTLESVFVSVVPEFNVERKGKKKPVMFGYWASILDTMMLLFKDMKNTEVLRKMI